MATRLAPERLALAGLALVLFGCGSTLRVATRCTPGEPGCPEVPPDVIRDPPPLTAETVRAWETALAAYEEATAEGWTAEACAAVSAGFERANEALGGHFARAIYMAAVAREACGDAEAAAAGYRAALEVDETLCGARVAIGIESFRAGRIDEARAAFERATREDSRCVEGYVNLAIVERRTPGGAGDALNDLRRALAIDASYLPAFDQMALLYLDEASRRGEALSTIAGGVPAVSGADFDAAADGEPVPGAELLALAEIVCRQAQLIDPGYAPIYNTWGLVNVRQGDIVGALAKFERATQLDPSLFEAHMNFGELTLGFRGYEDALAAFTRATELSATSYEAWIGLGAAERGLGRLAEAEAAYERARAIDPERPDAYFNLGVLHQDFGDGALETLDRATRFYEEFVARAGDAPAYAAIVEAVTRACEPEPPTGEDEPGARGTAMRRAHRRWARSACRPGRAQQIENEIAIRTIMASAPPGADGETAP